MAVLGRINKLKVSGIDPDGAYLDAGDAGELLLPKHLQPDDCKVGGSIDVFIYLVRVVKYFSSRHFFSFFEFVL